jgi:tetratricopeptide (TPR) repeat protein
MDNRFFTKAEFKNRFGKEMASAASVYETRKKGGMHDYSLATYDFVFISDKEAKVQQLGDFLKNNCGYEVREPKKINDFWEITGDAIEFPVDDNNLMFWALGLYIKGYEFDCKLDGYGASGDPNDQKYPDLTSLDADHYFALAMEAYNRGDLGMSVIHFSTAIRINPKDPNSWYSRAAIKDMLYTWKSARRDYDKAIELAPNFVDAIINRAANKDAAGEHHEAIYDYTRAIELDPENDMAYFNRGNSKFDIDDKKGACEDWNKALALGSDSAQQRIDQNCKPKSLADKAKKLFKW